MVEACRFRTFKVAVNTLWQSLSILAKRSVDGNKLARNFIHSYKYCDYIKKIYVDIMTAYDTSFGNNRVIRLQLPGGKGPLTKANTIFKYIMYLNSVLKNCF